MERAVEQSEATKQGTPHMDFGNLSCWDIERIYDRFRDGELPPLLHDKIEEHMKTCEECQMMVDTYELVVSVAATMKTPVPEPKAGFKERLHAALNKELGLNLSSFAE